MNASTALHDLDIVQLAETLRRREVSAVDVARHFLARIDAQAGLGAFLATDPEATLAQARAVDALVVLLGIQEDKVEELAKSLERSDLVNVDLQPSAPPDAG